MTVFLEMLTDLINGNFPPFATVMLFLFTLVVYKISSEYVKLIWFKLFPNDKKTKEISRLQAQVVRLEADIKKERELREEAVATAEVLSDRNAHLEKRWLGYLKAS